MRGFILRMEFCKKGGKVAVSSQCKKNPRTCAQRYAKSRQTRHDGCQNSSPATPRTKKIIRDINKGCARFCQIRIVHNPHHHPQKKYIYGNTSSKGDKYGPWYIFCGIFNLFGSNRNQVKPYVRYIYQTHGWE